MNFSKNFRRSTGSSTHMLNWINGLTLVGMMSVISGCTSLQTAAEDLVSPKPPCKSSLDSNLTSVSLQPILDGMTSELMAEACGPGTLGGFVVTDLVSISDLKPGTAGLIMGEVTRASLTRLQCQRVFQVEATNLLSLNDSGFVALSRRVNEVRPEISPVREAIVGTYHAWPDKMLLVLRRIDTQTGQLKRSVSREVNFSCKAR